MSACTPSNPRIPGTNAMLALALTLLACSYAWAQDSSRIIDNKEKEQSLNISGSMQFWLRYTEMNPGSLVNNEPASAYWDISIRRYRLRFSGNASEKLRYTFEMGNNDQSFLNNNANLPHILDAYVDYQLTDWLGLGLGKQAWAGPSRYSAPSTTQALGYDIDFVGAPFVNLYDDILRRMGVYARGQYKGFDYRISLAKPSVSATASKAAPGDKATLADKQPQYQLSGYLKHQFFDHESQTTPYSPGTYLGKKKILNLGIGALYQPNTSWSHSNGDTVYHAAKSLAADLFFEKGIHKNRAVTAYLSYHNHKLGPSFMRYMGANNPATGGIPSDWVNGRGNLAPVVGSGQIWYMQLGYLRPLDAENQQQLQFFSSLEIGRFDALNDPVLIYNTGVSYLMTGQRSKVTFGYQNRPVFKKAEHLVTQEMRRGMMVLQYQILFGK